MPNTAKLKNQGSGTFVLIGYCNGAVRFQQAFIFALANGILEIVFLATRWLDGMPNGMEYVRHPVKVERYQDYLIITSKEADVEFRLNTARYEGKFYTGLAAYSSGSNGMLNKQCVQDLVQYYLANVEI